MDASVTCEEVALTAIRMVITERKPEDYKRNTTLF
jgi:hypothetical protein